MKEEFNIKIPNPCSEDWSTMKTINKGRYCFNCSKPVIDLTKHTSNEIFNLVNQSNNGICGRVNSHQLNNSFKYRDNSSRFGFFNKWVVAFFLFFTSKSFVFSQENKQSTRIILSPSYQKDMVNNVIQKFDSSKFINGSVYDAETNEYLPFVNVFVKGTKIGTSTDIDGNFKFYIPDSIADNEIIIVAQYVGYDNVEKLIKRNALPLELSFSMSSSSQGMLGFMVIERVVVEKKKWWKRK